MKTINNIKPIPNQNIQIPIGDHSYTIRFIWCDTFVTYDLYVDDKIVVEGFRVVYGQLLIPYAYQEIDGNFILDTNGEEADYNWFGETQFLRYLTPDESASWREALKNGEY